MSGDAYVEVLCVPSSGTLRMTSEIGSAGAALLAGGLCNKEIVDWTGGGFDRRDAMATATIPRAAAKGGRDGGYGRGAWTRALGVFPWAFARESADVRHARISFTTRAFSTPVRRKSSP